MWFCKIEHGNAGFAQDAQTFLEDGVAAIYTILRASISHNVTTMPYLGCLLMKLFLWHSFLLSTTWMLIHISGFVPRIPFCWPSIFANWYLLLSFPDLEQNSFFPWYGFPGPHVKCFYIVSIWYSMTGGTTRVRTLTPADPRNQILRWDLAKLLLPCFQS